MKTATISKLWERRGWLWLWLVMSQCHTVSPLQPWYNRATPLVLYVLRHWNGQHSNSNCQLAVIAQSSPLSLPTLTVMAIIFICWQNPPEMNSSFVSFWPQVLSPGLSRGLWPASGGSRAGQANTMRSCNLCSDICGAAGAQITTP